MMAGAPGAFGSLVIFSSSGGTGWKPIAQPEFGIRMAARTKKNETRPEERRREANMALFPLSRFFVPRSRRPEGGNRGREATAGPSTPICRARNLCVETLPSPLPHVKKSPLSSGNGEPRGVALRAGVRSQPDISPDDPQSTAVPACRLMLRNLLMLKGQSEDISQVSPCLLWGRPGPIGPDDIRCCDVSQNVRRADPISS